MTLSEHSQALSRHIHQALTDDDNIQMVLGNPPRLYDSAPEDPIFPYLTYGPMRTTDQSADGAVISNHQISLHLWSRYSGRAEVLDLTKRVEAVLTSSALLSASDSQIIGANVIYTDVLRATDGRTLHGLLRLSFTLEA